jgi:hypothetical protein
MKLVEGRIPPVEREFTCEHDVDQHVDQYLDEHIDQHVDEHLAAADDHVDEHVLAADDHVDEHLAAADDHDDEHLAAADDHDDEHVDQHFDEHVDQHFDEHLAAADDDHHDDVALRRRHAVSRAEARQEEDPRGQCEQGGLASGARRHARPLSPRTRRRRDLSRGKEGERDPGRPRAQPG